MQGQVSLHMEKYSPLRMANPSVNAQVNLVLHALGQPVVIMADMLAVLRQCLSQVCRFSLLSASNGMLSIGNTPAANLPSRSTQARAGRYSTTKV